MSFLSPVLPGQTTIVAELVGSTGVYVDGRPFNYSTWRARSGVVPRVARELLKEGYDPKTILRVTRKGTMVFKDASLGAWAGLSVEETDHRSVRFTRYRPFALPNSGDVVPS